MIYKTGEKPDANSCCYEEIILNNKDPKLKFPIIEQMGHKITDEIQI